MARPSQPCPVPGCKGRLERGKHPDGETREWCAVCERRLLQLRALQEKLDRQERTQSRARAADGAPRDPTDAELLQMVRDRLVLGRGATQVAGRSLNLILQAEKDGRIPSVVLGRCRLFGRKTLQAWGRAYERKPIVLPQTREYIAALPREESAAITPHELVRRAKREVAAAQNWIAKNAALPQLRRRAALDKQGRARLLLWWQEGGSHV